MTKPELHCFIVMTSNGYWGRGQTLMDAALACKKAGARADNYCVASLVVGDDEPEVDGYGFICHGGKEKQGSKLISIGLFKRLGSLYFNPKVTAKA